MGRPLRVECAGGFFHVLSRGNERRDIFRDDQDCGLRASLRRAAITDC